MNKSDLEKIADRFRKLPFASLERPEIDALARDIVSARNTYDLAKVIVRLSRDIMTHQYCDNWGKADLEAGVRNDLLDLDEIFSLDEKTRLRDIVHAKAKDFSEIRSSSIVLKMPAWAQFLKERGVRRIDHCEEGKVNLNDPFGGNLVMTEETARKILALGL